MTVVEGGAFGGNPWEELSQCGKFKGMYSITQPYTSLIGKSAMNLFK